MGQKNVRRRRNATRSKAKGPNIRLENIQTLNTALLKQFQTDGGKIVPRRVSKVSAKIHRKLTRAIKRGRTMLVNK
jgi:small subunit ribosomal protein S18